MQTNVRQKFASYPEHVQPVMYQLRALIYETAMEHDLGEVIENLKWQEPSYVVNGGSPVRIDWKAKSPNHCFIFFNCNTKLVDTFKELYKQKLNFQGNRAIVLTINEPLPMAPIKHCIILALQYHQLKNLPLLGALAT